MSLFNLHNNTMKYSHLLSFVCELEALETLLENQSTSHEHLLGFRILTVPQSYQLESLPRLVRLRASLVLEVWSEACLVVVISRKWSQKSS